MKSMFQVQIRPELLLSVFAVFSMLSLSAVGQDGAPLNAATVIGNNIAEQPSGVQQVQWLGGYGGGCRNSTCNGAGAGCGECGSGGCGEGGKSLFGVNQSSPSGLKRESGGRMPVRFRGKHSASASTLVRIGLLTLANTDCEPTISWSSCTC